MNMYYGKISNRHEWLMLIAAWFDHCRDLPRFVHHKKGPWSVPETRNMKISFIYYLLCCVVRLLFNSDSGLIWDQWQISVNCFGSKKMRPCNSWLRFPKMYDEERFQGWTNFTISSVSSTLIDSSHFHYNPSALLLFFNTVSTFLPGWKGPRPDRIVWGAQLTQSRSSWSCYPNKLPNGRYSYVSAWPCFQLQTKNKKQFGS